MLSVFTSLGGTQPNVQANLSGLGWRSIVPGAPEAVTNFCVLLSDAAVSGRRANVWIDANGMIGAVYLA